MKNWFSKRSSSASNIAVVWLELSSHPGYKPNIWMESEHMAGATYSDTKNNNNSQVLPQCTQTLSETDDELVRSDRPAEVMEMSSETLVVISGLSSYTNKMMISASCCCL